MNELLQTGGAEPKGLPLRRLYEIMTSNTMTHDEKMVALLELGCAHFGVESGVITKVIADGYIAEYVVSPHSFLRPGVLFDPSFEIYCLETIQAREAIYFHHASQTSWQDHPCFKRYGLETYLGAPIVLNERMYGALSFTALAPLPQPFSTADVELLLLMVQWIGSEMQRRQATENMRLYANIFDSTTEGIVILNRQGQITTLNPAFTKLTGFSRAEMQQMPPTELIAAPDAEPGLLRDILSSLASTGHWQGELLVHTKQGQPSPQWVTVSALQDQQGVLEQYVVVFTDLSELKQAERRLEESEQSYRSLFAHNPDAVLSINHTGHYYHVNPEAEKQTGYKAEEMYEKTFHELIMPEERPHCNEHFAICLSGQPTKFETKILHRAGHLVDIHVTAVPIIVHERVIGVHAITRDITDRKRTEALINHMAYHDPLTELPNRRLFTDRLEAALERVQRGEEKLAVIFLDMDRFKVINDSLGHSFGNELLKAIAVRLTACVSPEQTVARMGGDEFTVLMPCIRCECDVEPVAKRMLAELEKPFVLDGREFYITGSMGIALAPEHGLNADELMKQADHAMYYAKEQGKNTYQFYQAAMQAKASKRLTLENELHKALMRGEISIYYQPQVAIDSQQVIGFEALLRWQHPVLGRISPADFIPIAEETGLIVPIGEWVLRTACHQSMAWQRAGYAPLRVAVNLSARQFQQRNLTETVANVLRESGLPPAQLELEITESIAMFNTDRVIEKLHALHRLGIQIAIDDFGTGYSSLSYLRKFPIHTLKIDRSFISDISADADNASIVSVILAMAKTLKLNAIAEGVETHEQLDFLERNGCQEMQGYLFSRPLPAELFEKEILR